MRYSIIFSPLQKDWCLPASIQTLLHRRRINISQKNISREFERATNGFMLDNDKLNSFLKRFSLNSIFFNQFFEQFDDAESFLRENSENDILVGYNYGLTNRRGEKEQRANHIALIDSYDLQRNIIHLAEPNQQRVLQVKLYDILNATHPDIDKNNGFYAIT